MIGWTNNKSVLFFEVKMAGILGRLGVAFSLFSSVCICSALGAPNIQDARDGHVYKTISSGKLNWFASNLSFKDSASIPIKGASAFYTRDKWAKACPDSTRVPTGAEWDSLLVAEFKGPNKQENMKKFVGTPRGFYHTDAPNDLLGLGSAFFAIADGEPRAMLFDMDNWSMRFIKLGETSAVNIRCVKERDILGDMGISKEKMTFRDSRDGNEYKVEIRDSAKVWMIQNLKYGFKDAKQCYMDDTSYCTRFGRFFTYKEALNACPEGWHLPDDGEWRDYQKDQSKLNWKNLGQGGCKDWDGYCEMNTTGHYWSKTSLNDKTARAWEFRSKGRSIDRSDESIQKGLYVRCVADLK